MFCWKIIIYFYWVCTCGHYGSDKTHLFLFWCLSRFGTKLFISRKYLKHLFVWLFISHWFSSCALLQNSKLCQGMLKCRLTCDAVFAVRTAACWAWDRLLCNIVPLSLVPWWWYCEPHQQPFGPGVPLSPSMPVSLCIKPHGIQCHHLTCHHMRKINQQKTISKRSYTLLIISYCKILSVYC